MKRGGPLKRGKPLGSDPEKQRAWLQKSAKRLAPRSPKRIKEDRERAKAKAKVFERANGKCVAAALIVPVDPLAAKQCRGIAMHAHEPKTRARGGSITDEAGMIATCDRCHSWIHSNPAKATQVGLLVPSWDVPESDEMEQ